ncbi:hypothetical protein [Granulicella arctica]|uniref:Uncharacterized protein n=1 Tax=Granulicella arctica TaxID=940613 RepID=A0A7Y9THS6_9BACT|nr:hypothetical protein [Granulicella arctica]NYF80200.1 hypothetical protein [Granulicella arctica]
MPIPDQPTYFEAQEAAHFYAAQGAFFLVDPARLHHLMGDDLLSSDLIRTLTRKSYPHDAYREGTIVPALGVEQGHYTVTVRSTQTENAPLPLSHMLFSTGFVLGTETGNLLLANTDRLQHWSPGQLPDGQEEHPLSSYERTIHISPGWYQVTVVAGILDNDQGSEEEWVCAFLLDPQPSQPTFTADLAKTLTF